METLLNLTGQLRYQDGHTYTALLAPEGVETSDGRFIEEGGLSWREGRLPLMWSDNEAAHDDAIHVANLENLRKETIDGIVWVVSDIDWDTDDDAVEAKRLVDEDRLRGVSIHMADMDADTECPDDENKPCTMTVHLGVIAAATIVAIPAFADAQILVAAVSGAADLPLAARDAEWDSAAAQASMFGPDEENPDFETARNGHFYVRDQGELKGDYVLPFAQVIDGTLTAVPAGVFACAGGHGVDQVDGLSADERDAIKSRICGYYDRITTDEDPIECPFTATVAAVDLFAPPREWFDDPGLTEPTFCTVTDEGRVYGHLTPPQDRCHLGFPDHCVRPPYGNVDYEEFNSHARVNTEDGALLPVGVLTFNGPHAPVDRLLSVQDRIRHYDHTGTVGAYVRAGEDEYGTWIAGAIAPGLSNESIEAIRRLSLSGDWLPRGDQQVLIAALAVPVPGFSIRAKVAGAMFTVGPAPVIEKPDLVLVADALVAVRDMIRDVRDTLAPIVEERREAEARARAEEAFAAF